jgi:hypothetical protein
MMMMPFNCSYRKKNVEERAKDRYHPVARLGCTWVSCARACVVVVKVHCVFFAAALSKWAVMVAREKGKHENLET